MRVQLSSFLQFYLLYLLLNSCDAFWRHFVFVKQSSPSAGNTRFISLDLCSPNSLVDYRICGLMQERVYIVQTPVRDTSRCDQRLETASRWHNRASISQNAIDKAVGQQKKRLRASMKAKWHHLEHLLNQNRLFSELTHYKFVQNRIFSEPPTVYWEKHVVSHHFH